MLSPLKEASLFLINTLFDIYLLILIIRSISYWVRIDYYHPITQFVVRLTQPIIDPLKRFIPAYKNVESASLVALILLDTIKFLFVGLIAVGLPNVLGLIIVSCADIFKLFLNTFFFAILLQVILSWIQQGSPIYFYLTQLISPIMQPIQRFIPPVSGIDLSPLAALILLQLCIILLANPLINLGMGIAFG